MRRDIRALFDQRFKIFLLYMYKKNLPVQYFLLAACEGRTLRSVVVLQELAEMQPDDASPCLLASRY
jgi:hypothetical protein